MKSLVCPFSFFSSPFSLLDLPVAFGLSSSARRRSAHGGSFRQLPVPVPPAENAGEWLRVPRCSPRAVAAAGRARASWHTLHVGCGCAASQAGSHLHGEGGICFTLPARWCGELKPSSRQEQGAVPADLSAVRKWWGIHVTSCFPLPRASVCAA